MIRLLMNNASGFSISNTQLLILVLSATVAMWMARFYWSKRHFFRSAALIPDSSGAPFYGLALEFVMNASEGIFRTLIRYTSLNSDLFKIWFGTKLVIVLNKPEHFEKVLTSKDCLEKNYFYDFTKPYAGDGLFTAPVTKWKKNRKLLNPTFNQKVLDNFVETFSEKSTVLMDILEKYTDDPDFDIIEKLSACTLDTICQTAMGLNTNAQTNTNHYGNLLDRGMELITMRILKIIYTPQIIFDLVHGKDFKEIIGALRSFSRKVYTEQKKIFDEKREDINNGSYFETEDCEGRTFLKLLLQVSYNGGNLNAQQIQDEVNTIIAAGSDTSATCLAFCCLLLAMYPNYQQKVYEEALEVLGEDSDLTAEDIPKLQFLDMCLKETLRIFPIVPLIARVAMADIKIGNYIIPENSSLLLSIFNMQRNPKYWPDPLVFNPYRFLPEECAKMQPFVYVPFSAGKRDCIGKKYAFMVMKSILTKLIRRFELKTTYTSIQEVKLKVNLLIRPVEGFKVTLKRRI